MDGGDTWARGGDTWTEVTRGRAVQMQILFRFCSDSVQILFRFSSDSLQILFRFSSDSDLSAPVEESIEGGDGYCEEQPRGDGQLGHLPDTVTAKSVTAKSVTAKSVTKESVTKVSVTDTWGWTARTPRRCLR